MFCGACYFLFGNNFSAQHVLEVVLTSWLRGPPPKKKNLYWTVEFIENVWQLYLFLFLCDLYNGICSVFKNPKVIPAKLCFCEEYPWAIREQWNSFLEFFHSFSFLKAFNSSNTYLHFLLWPQSWNFCGWL